MRQSRPNWNPTSLVGTVLGKYELERLIGQGGMGAVFAARHRDLRRPAAIKVMHARIDTSDDAQRRFLREGRAAARIQHRNIVDVYDVGSDAGLLYLVMELLEGEDLRSLLRREPRLPVARAADLLVPLVAGVAAAHASGVIHRDLKPENLFLVRERAALVPKVLDFGISKLDELESERSLTHSGSLLGTPHYLSPEQASGQRDVDARSDQYALGVILYECVLGGRPIEEPTLYRLIQRIVAGDFVRPRQRDSSLPSQIEDIIVTAMAREPTARFTDTSALGRALLEFASPRVRASYEEELAAGPAAAIAVPAALMPGAPRARLAADVEQATLPQGIAEGLAPHSDGVDPGSTLGQELPPVRTRQRARRPRPLVAAIALLALAGSALLLSWRLGSSRTASTTTALRASPGQLRTRMLTSFPATNAVDRPMIASDGESYIYSDAAGVWHAGVDRRKPPRRLEQLDPSKQLVSLMPGGAVAVVLTASSTPEQEQWVIELRPLAGGESRWLPLGPDCPARAYVTQTIQPSPDGGELLVSCSDKLLVVDAEDGRVRRIADWGTARLLAGVAWSPDGAHIAVITRSSVRPDLPELSVLRADGSAATRLLSERGLINSRASTDGAVAWLDARRLLFSRLNDVSEPPGSALLELTLEADMTASGPPRVLHSYEHEFASSLTVAYGSRRAIAILTRTQGDVMVGDLNGSTPQLANVQRLTLDESDDRPGAWLADGRVAFMSDRMGNWDIFAQAPGSADVDLLAGSAAWETWVGRLGAFPAFWRFDAVPATGRRQAQLVRLEGPGQEHAVLSDTFDDELLREAAPPPLATRFDCGGPEHTVCVLSQRRPLPSGLKGMQFRRFDPGTGQLQEPFHVRSGQVDFWAVSPDGTQLALAGDQLAGLVLVSIASGEAREVPLPSVVWQSIHWLPDGTGVVLTGMDSPEYPYLIARASLRGETTVLYGNDAAWLTQALPSPDGKHLAFGALHYERNLQLIEGW